MGGHVTAEEVVQFATALLDAGARMDVRDGLLKSTPLGWACVELLLERGADAMEARFTSSYTFRARVIDSAYVA